MCPGCVRPNIDWPFLAIDLSDLNVKVAKDGTSAQPLTNDGFAFLWGGVKATHGAAKGKVCFEVKVCVLRYL